ncbi:polysaccharide biosynthesis protein [Lachnospiraceae bacterium OttesenSCG-928-J05]|nr:polysaccharide biosynthesis protein [Lachnospiraceae bacterium OttesenSCG-928-J05]
MAGNKQSKSNDFLVQGSILAVAGIITKVIGLVYRVPLNNILGKEGNGYYSMAFSIYIVFWTLTSYSLPLAVSKLVSARIAKGQYKNAYKVFRGAMSLAVGVGGAVSILLFLFANTLASVVMKSDLSVYAIRVLAPCIFVVSVLGTLRGFFQGIGSMVPTAVSQILEQIVNAIASIAGAYVLFNIGKDLGKTAEGTSYGAAYSAAGGTIGTVLGAFVALLFMLLVFVAYKKYFKRKMKRDGTKKSEDTRYILKILLLTITPILISATITNMNDFLDGTIFNNVMAAQGMAKKDYIDIYGVFGGRYSTLIAVPISIGSALAASFIPSLVASMQTRNKKEVFGKIESTYRFNMIVMIPCAVALFVLARPILDLLFSGDNTLAANMLRVGALSILFFGYMMVSNAVLQGIDEMGATVKNAFIALIVYVVAQLFMLVVLKLGIYGVIISRIIYGMTASYLNAKDVRRYIGYVQEKKRTYVIPGISAAIMGIIAFFSQLVLELFLPGKVATLITCMVAVIVYFVVLILLGGIKESEMKGMPKGHLLIKICRKLHLYR